MASASGEYFAHETRASNEKVFKDVDVARHDRADGATRAESSEHELNAYAVQTMET